MVGGITIAGAISTALYRRAMTGEPSVIDASLLASGMWQIQMEVTSACIDPPGPARSVPDRYEAANPLMLAYRTSDGRFIVLQMLASDRHWPDLCRLIGEPGMATDVRFVDMARQEGRTPAPASAGSIESSPLGDFDEWRSDTCELRGRVGAFTPPRRTGPGRPGRSQPDT